MSDSIVLIPTYNEKENIKGLIRQIFSLTVPFHILVIDDGSPDGTAGIVRDLMKAYPGQLFLEERPGKQGLGTAYIHGFRWALGREYEFIYEMDADFSHNPDDLPRLRETCLNGADLAIGSRYITGVNVVNWPMGRVLMSYAASVYVRVITGMDIRDFTAGFKCYRRKVLETIRFDKIRFVGYAFQIEMKFTAVKHGFKVVEIPIIFTDRTHGTSKMSRGIIKEAVLGIIRMKMRSWFRKYEAEPRSMNP